MPTVIDEFIVKLGLDPSDFNRQQKKAGEEFIKTKQTVVAGGKEIENTLGKMGVAAAEFFGAFASARALVDFAIDVVKTDAYLGRLAYSLDTTVSTLSKWRGAATLAGGSAKGITSTIEHLTDEIQNFAITGQSTVIPYFRALGIATVDSRGKMRDMGDILLDVADRIHGLDPARARAFLENMGIDQDTINILLQGKPALQAYLDEMQKIGVASNQDSAAAIKLKQSWNELSLSATALGRNMVTAVSPALLSIIEDLKTMSGLLSFIFTHKWSWDDLVKAGKPQAGYWDPLTGGPLPAQLGTPGANRASTPTGASPRGLRNNNPGNLRAWGDNPVVGGFAQFPTQQAGLNAMAKQLEFYAKRGWMSINDIVSHWAPESDHNNTAAYIRSISAVMGVDASAKLNLQDPNVLSRLMRAMITQEQGQQPFSGGQIASAAGGALIGRIPTGGAAASPVVSSVSRNTTNSSSSTNTAHVGTVIVNTQATDAAGIARDIGSQLQRTLFGQQANYGAI